MADRSTLATRRAEDADGDDAEERRGGRERLLADYLDLLEQQRLSPSGRPWSAFHELRDIAENFELIIDVNAQDARTGPLEESARYVASLLRQQHPVGGMAGTVNRTLVRQFRMPGYPFVLVTTDLLQEGEDLHTFCSSVQHYGISWTPSAMEQRIGRIDRVRSQAERRLSAIAGEPAGEDWLQVYFPYLQDTVEVLQVERVLDRMSTFLRLMHEGFSGPTQDQRRIDVQREIVAPRKTPATIHEPLRSAFPVPEWALRGTRTKLAVEQTAGREAGQRFAALRRPQLGGLPLQWAPHPPRNTLLGTVRLDSGRTQPIMLVMRLEQGRHVIRCVSPIGRTEAQSDPASVAQCAARVQSRVAAVLTTENRSYDLTVEDDVLLGAAKHDAERVGLLVLRVAEWADRMEREHFTDGRDEPIGVFEVDLRKETADAS